MEQGTRLGRIASDVSHVIVTSALKVQSALGPRLLESAYEACLMHELTKSGLKVASQVDLPLVYDGLKLDIGVPSEIRFVPPGLVKGAKNFKSASCIKARKPFSQQQLDAVCNRC